MKFITDRSEYLNTRLIVRDEYIWPLHKLLLSLPAWMDKLKSQKTMRNIEKIRTNN